MKICHLTSVHPRYDTRIFVKECKSIANAGFETYLIVADGNGTQIIDGVNIIDAGQRHTNRIKRIYATSKKVLQKALEVDADLYHFHDPELISIGLKLKRKGKKVIYDVHENLPHQILSKYYINKFLRYFISKIFKIYEDRSAKRFSAIVCATPFIRDRFLKLNKNSIDIKNFPKLDEFNQIHTKWSERKNDVCYIGAITDTRGIKEIVKAVESVNCNFQLAGDFSNDVLKKEIESYEGWKKANFYGFVGREEISKILSTVKIGLVILHPTDAYKQAYPVKMFEYMAAGVPVLASDFELYKQIIDEAQCGMTVNPLDSDKIAQILTQMLNNEQMLEQMSINGQKAAKVKFNWNNEEKKLLELYEKIIH